MVAALLAGAGIPVSAGSACAGEGARAALVVDAGDDGGTYRYCVQLPGELVSGIELIQLAGRQHGLQYRLDDGGQAVCTLAGVGAEGDDCFGEYPDFWGYWRGDGSGGWSWSSSGGGSTLVEDGDIEGWSWGSGQDGASHPEPPPTTFSSVCKPQPAAAPPKPQSEKSDDNARPPRPHRTAAGTNTEVAPTKPVRRNGSMEAHSRRKGGAKRPLSDETAPESNRPPAAGAGAPEAATDLVTHTGPSAAGLAAIGVAAALGAGAVLMRRRRS